MKITNSYQQVSKNCGKKKPNMYEKKRFQPKNITTEQVFGQNLVK